MNVYFMRHGNTDWNTVKRLQGTTDIPLNAKGIELAEKTAEAVFEQGIIFDRIYSSPLIRAKQTAEIMNKYSKTTIVLDSRISEFCFGKGEGIVFSEILENKEFENIMNWFKNPEKYEARDGSESFEHFFSRIQSFLDELAEIEKKPDAPKNILLVCHGGVLRGLFKQMANLSISKFSELNIPNCSMNLAELSNGNYSIKWSAKVF